MYVLVHVYTIMKKQQQKFLILVPFWNMHEQKLQPLFLRVMDILESCEFLTLTILIAS